MTSLFLFLNFITTVFDHFNIVLVLFLVFVEGIVAPVTVCINVGVVVSHEAEYHHVHDHQGSKHEKFTGLESNKG